MKWCLNNWCFRSFHLWPSSQFISLWNGDQVLCSTRALDCIRQVYNQFLERLLSSAKCQLFQLFRSRFHARNAGANFLPVLARPCPVATTAKAGKWRDTCSDMIPRTHKNWQQIFRAGRITWIFHDACRRRSDQMRRHYSEEQPEEVE